MDRAEILELITTMALKGASHEELADAITYSADVIKSEIDLEWSRLTHNINHLKEKYSG